MAYEKKEQAEGCWTKASSKGNGILIKRGGVQEFISREDIEKIFDEANPKEWGRSVLYSIVGKESEEADPDSSNTQAEGSWFCASKSGNGLVIDKGGTIEFLNYVDLQAVMDENDDKEWARTTIYTKSNRDDDADDFEGSDEGE